MPKYNLKHQLETQLQLDTQQLVLEPWFTHLPSTTLHSNSNHHPQNTIASLPLQNPPTIVSPLLQNPPTFNPESFFAMIFEWKAHQEAVNANISQELSGMKSNINNLQIQMKLMMTKLDALSTHTIYPNLTDFAHQNSLQSAYILLPLSPPYPEHPPTYPSQLPQPYFYPQSLTKISYISPPVSNPNDNSTIADDNTKISHPSVVTTAKNIAPADVRIVEPLKITTEKMAAPKNIITVEILESSSTKLYLPAKRCSLEKLTASLAEMNFSALLKFAPDVVYASTKSYAAKQETPFSHPQSILKFQMFFENYFFEFEEIHCKCKMLGITSKPNENKVLDIQLERKETFILRKYVFTFDPGGCISLCCDGFSTQ